MDSSDLKKTYPYTWLYQAQQQEQNSTIISNYPKLANIKSKTKYFRKKSLFYDPNLQLTTHTKGRPPYSYATLITYAINKSPLKRLSLNQIYEWLEQHYPYLKTSTRGWKNSVRHNLSHNPTFYKVSRPVGEPGKGSLWTIDETMLNELSCNNLQFDQLKQSSTSNHSPASNSDSGFALPQNTQLPRRSTVSDIYHPYFSQNTRSTQVTNSIRHFHPMVNTMNNYSISSISCFSSQNTGQTADLTSDNNIYTKYIQPTSSYTPYQNSFQTLTSTRLLEDLQQFQLHNQLNLVSSLNITSNPPSKLVLPYSNFSKTL